MMRRKSSVRRAHCSAAFDSYREKRCSMDKGGGFLFLSLLFIIHSIPASMIPVHHGIDPSGIYVCVRVSVCYLTLLIYGG